MDNQRLILFVALGLLFLMLWQSWVEYSSPTQPVHTNLDSVNGDIVDKGSIPETPKLSSDTPSLMQDSETQVINKKPTGETVLVETDTLKVELNTFGAGINKAWLKKY